MRPTWAALWIGVGKRIRRRRGSSASWQPVSSMTMVQGISNEFLDTLSSRIAGATQFRVCQELRLCEKASNQSRQRRCSTAPLAVCFTFTVIASHQHTELSRQCQSGNMAQQSHR
jgi:hypothetical protein